MQKLVEKVFLFLLIPMLLDRDSDHGRLVPTWKHSDPDPEYVHERLCCIQPQLHDDPDGSPPRPSQVYASCQGKIPLVAKFKNYLKSFK